MSRLERNVVLVSTLVKVLLFPAYHSTDFEVHRNWLAITHSLPLTQWYFDATSEWTLDYPPFFAYFEKFWSVFAYLVDPAIVDVNNLGYASLSCVIFQRATVVLSELVLVAAVFHYASRAANPATLHIIAAAIVFHPGLLIVDHIHFQYNGFLLGLLVWSLDAARSARYPLVAFLFASLLCFKHIFVYLAPPYFVFLFRNYCVGSAAPLARFVQLGAIVLAVAAAAFGPFVLAGGLPQLQQIATRLFPFQRGLIHAYWAPNAWALYALTDRVFLKYLSLRGWPVSDDVLQSASRGIVGTTRFGVLPDISPAVCFALTLACITVLLTKLWTKPTYDMFLDSVTLSAMTSFLFGWHVHEKAVLLFLIPLTLSATRDSTHYTAFQVASVSGVVGLFPLLIKSQETPVKITLLVLWAYVVLPLLRRVVFIPTPSLFTYIVSCAERFYLYGFVLLETYVVFIHDIVFTAHSAEFFPLLLTSVYCAVGIIYVYARLGLSFLLE